MNVADPKPVGPPLQIVHEGRLRDCVSPEERLAGAEPVEQPGWITDLVAALCFVLMVALAAAAGHIVRLTAELDVMEGERDLWMEFALAPDPRATVVIERDRTGFRCSNLNVRREWELAVAAECQVMGRLLQMASDPKP